MTGYPFAAIVGHDDLRLALILNSISPTIGGVVVRGEKGTAKTTTIRGFATLMNGPLVNLPIGATEDRVVGSLDVETVLTTGRAEYKPGLLAQADGGILYVDEVNLLPDHLVDALLDAAATGQVTIERDGISHTSPARFVLVGSMNPEEGELRPQLLDRFGLAVEVAASRDVEVRCEIMRRRLAFDAAPQTFAAHYADQERALSEQLEQARTLLPDVELPDAMLARIAHVCATFDVDGMRADLVIARTACAHAAWRGAQRVGEEDIAVAAKLALPHRKRRDPFDDTGLDEDQLDQALDEAKEQFPEQPENTEDDGGAEQQPPQPEQSDADLQPPQDTPDEQPTQDGKAGRADIGAPFRP
ncbi:ATP-binding protein [Corynebacterium aquilae]|uniref:Magnesium chelatase n=1 Tax=Corynebacterium aquilae DSM 44791 TaxID=1431546 RepID=A0A1L7CGN6_9CORY|nr:AAA family ATPase [Corynebacterium aquilae]APT84984.1 magnesium chelatase [Corynebacterium aquilae DSM 44791]